jgi:8-oxo-dGTP pyrophosphatase MutT (NUDIX family)
MIEAAIVTAIRARLTTALAPSGEPLHPLRVDDNAAGWLNADRAARLTAFADIFRVDDDAIRFVPSLSNAQTRTDALDRVAGALAAEGALTAWRDERYAIAPRFGAPPWFLLERAAARYFGVPTYAAHVNGLVDGEGAASMWFARRSATKPIDPGMLDNLVGGGIAAGHTIAETVIKESWEEAGIDAALAGRARHVGTVDVRRMQPDGLQRETIFVHDLALPRDFTPGGPDGEVVGHRLVDLETAARLIANDSGPDVVTVDASLVVLDCLLRQGAIAADPRLRALAAPPAGAPQSIVYNLE